ncbi:MAG: thioredoxin domain-containing protein [Chlorobiales bacterium]|nr:thioredoxin domain-containing protein [Chlorobiales bacterium]
MSSLYPYTNRLANEKSPYLIQHAHNPVDWFAWGEDAFEKARKENKPIFLSIGYSTCHWCHVMERESFENEEVAKVLNDYFVAIKVDREERPDLDRVYMTYVQATTGNGGWPMSVWLTSDLKPFLGGTYYPPEDRYGRPGFKTLLVRIAESWKNDKEKIMSVANGTADQLRAFLQASAKEAKVPLDTAVFEKCLHQIAHIYDPDWGGFGAAPKFPRPAILNFLFNQHYRTKDTLPLDMALFTLRKMAEGGIHDLLSVEGKGGGGFARYSTDPYWHVPHFEKMLYDNAQLALSYLDAYQLSTDRFYADIARDIFNYVLCDMTDKHGGFYSAEDADSLPSPESTEKTEGGFYVWTTQEIDSALGREHAEIFSYIYDLKPGGNAAYDPHGEFAGKNILTVRATLHDAAKKFGKSELEVETILRKSTETLFDIRLKRPRPHCDDKVLTSWNGLMISAFAKGYMALRDERYLNAAKRAADFILEKMYKPDTGRLLRRYRDGEAAIDAKVDDYAFFVQALIDLYEASFEPKYLTTAIRLTEKQNELFYDRENGAYFSAAEDDATVIFRIKEDHDGAEPSPNSVTALNLLRLSQMTDRQDFREFAEKTMAFFSRQLSEMPEHMPQMLVALDYYFKKPKQIILAGPLGTAQMADLRRAIYERYLPNKVVLHASDDVAAYMPFLKELIGSTEKPTAFICIDYACQLPTSEAEKVKALLEQA